MLAQFSADIFRLGRPVCHGNAGRDLARRIAAAGTVEARVLQTRSAQDEASLSGALGARVGGTAQVQRTSARLLAAASRGLDGAWLPRTDCVPESQA